MVLPFARAASSRSLSLGAVAALGLIVAALPLAIVLNVWQDEAFTLHTVAFGPLYAFREALAFEQSAPLYFVLVSLWYGVSGAVWFLRLFSIACAAGAVACVPALVRRYLPSIDPILPTVTIAWNPLALWAALEMRPYALIALLSALLLLTFYDAFVSRLAPAKGAIAYAIAATLALYTQFYLAFLIAGLGIALAIYYRASLVRFVTATVAALVLFAPLMVVIPSQVGNFRAPFPPPSLALSLASLALPISKFVLPAPVSLKLLAVLVTVALVAISVAAARARRRAQFFLPLATLAAALVFAAVTHVAHVVVLNRHVTSLYVPSVLSVYALIGMLDARARNRVAVIWCACALAGATVVMAMTYAPLAKPGDWIRVHAYLEEHERPGEPIAVFEAENALPLRYYYRGQNRIVAIPSEVNFRRYDLASFIVRDAAQLRRTFPKSERLWLVRTAGCQAGGLAFGCPTIDAYVKERYRTLMRKSFYQVDVSLLQKK